jgi:predicted lipoprotein with Yx(FWY)xxD motif
VGFGILGVPLAAVAILAAAGGGSTPAAGAGNNNVAATTAVAPAQTTPTQTPTAPATTAAAGPAMTLKTQSGSYGVWLTDQAGRTLYMLTADKGTTSSCYGACATAWPPLVTTGAVSASGAVVAADLGTTTRTDGTTQVTYAGHPLYYFAKETGPDQVLGFGAQGAWFLIAPSGTMMNPPVMAPPRMAPPPMTRPHMMPPPMTRPHMMPPPMTRPGMGGGMGGMG